MYKKSIFGLALKILSIISKIAFIFLIAPKLPEGEFTQYYTALTIALISARIISCSAEEQYPLIVRGSIAKINDLSSFFYFLLLISCIAFFLTSLQPQKIYLIISFSVSLVSSAFIGGIIRSYKPEAYEILINLPWLLFLLVTLGLKIDDHLRLLLGIIFCQIVTQILVLFIFRITFHRRNIFKKTFANKIKETCFIGIRKTISSALQILSTRGLLVSAKIFGIQIIDDSLAFAISLAEAAWQLLMVLSNRNYVKYCKNKINNKNALTTSMLLFISMITLGIFAGLFWFLFGSFIVEFFPLPISTTDIIPSFVVLGFILFFVNYRYYLWANVKSTFIIDFTFFLIFLVQVVATLFVRYEYWLITTSISCLIVVLLYYFTFYKMVENK